MRLVSNPPFVISEPPHYPSTKLLSIELHVGYSFKPLFIMQDIMYPCASDDLYTKIEWLLLKEFTIISWKIYISREMWLHFLKYFCYYVLQYLLQVVLNTLLTTGLVGYKWGSTLLDAVRQASWLRSQGGWFYETTLYEFMQATRIRLENA